MCKFVRVTIYDVRFIVTILCKIICILTLIIFSDHVLPPEHYERGRLNPRDGSTEQQQQVVLTGKQIIWNINKYRSFQDNGLFLWDMNLSIQFLQKVNVKFYFEIVKKCYKASQDCYWKLKVLTFCSGKCLRNILES